MEKKNRYFKKRSRNSHMPAVSGPRNCTILAISGPRIRNQKSPKWYSFWGHKLPGNGYFWSHKLPKWFSFVSGAINFQNGIVSGARNCKNGRQILYERVNKIIFTCHYLYRASLTNLLVLLQVVIVLIWQLFVLHK